MSYNKYTKNERIEWLKALWDAVINDGDERLWMSLIWIIPDEPQEDDFEFIAENEDLWEDCWTWAERNWFYKA